MQEHQVQYQRFDMNIKCVFFSQKNPMCLNIHGKNLFQEPQTGELATQDMQTALPNSPAGICQTETLKTSFAQPANCTHLPTLEHRRITNLPAGILRCSSSTANNLAEAILSFSDKEWYMQ